MTFQQGQVQRGVARARGEVRRFLSHHTRLSQPTTDAAVLAMSELLGNAAQYARQGGAELTVEATDARVRISIADTSLGLPEWRVESNVDAADEVAPSSTVNPADVDALLAGIDLAALDSSGSNPSEPGDRADGEHGRGARIVTENAIAIGTDVTPNGKTVWVEYRTPPKSYPVSPGSALDLPEDRARRGDGAEVIAAPRSKRGLLVEGPLVFHQAPEGPSGAGPHPSLPAPAVPQADSSAPSSPPNPGVAAESVPVEIQELLAQLEHTDGAADPVQIATLVRRYQEYSQERASSIHREFLNNKKADLVAKGTSEAAAESLARQAADDFIHTDRGRDRIARDAVRSTQQWARNSQIPMRVDGAAAPSTDVRQPPVVTGERPTTHPLPKVLLAVIAEIKSAGVDPAVIEQAERLIVERYRQYLRVPQESVHRDSVAKRWADLVHQGVPAAEAELRARQDADVFMQTPKARRMVESVAANNTRQWVDKIKSRAGQANFNFVDWLARTYREEHAIPSEPTAGLTAAQRAVSDYVDAVRVKLSAARGRAAALLRRHPELEVNGGHHWLTAFDAHHRALGALSHHYSEGKTATGNPVTRKTDIADVEAHEISIRGLLGEIQLAEQFDQVDAVCLRAEVEMPMGARIDAEIDVVTDGKRVWREVKTSGTKGQATKAAEFEAQARRQLHITHLNHEYWVDGAPPQVKWHFLNGVRPGVKARLEAIRIEDESGRIIHDHRVEVVDDSTRRSGRTSRRRRPGNEPTAASGTPQSQPGSETTSQRPGQRGQLSTSTPPYRPDNSSPMMTHAEFDARLATAERSGEPVRTYPPSVNSTSTLLHVAEYPDGFVTVEKSGLTREQQIAEVVVSFIGRILEVPVAPVLEVGPGLVVMPWLSGTPSRGSSDDPGGQADMLAVLDHPDARSLGMLDVVVGNWDRANNWMRGDRLTGFDHALSLGTASVDPASSPWSRHFVRAVNPRAEGDPYEWIPNDLSRAKVAEYIERFHLMRWYSEYYEPFLPGWYERSLYNLSKIHDYARRTDGIPEIHATDPAPRATATTPVPGSAPVEPRNSRHVHAVESSRYDEQNPLAPKRFRLAGPNRPEQLERARWSHHDDRSHDNDDVGVDPQLWDKPEPFPTNSPTDRPQQSLAAQEPERPAPPPVQPPIFPTPAGEFASANLDAAANTQQHIWPESQSTPESPAQLQAWPDPPVNEETEQAVPTQTDLRARLSTAVRSRQAVDWATMVANSQILLLGEDHSNISGRVFLSRQVVALKAAGITHFAIEAGSHPAFDALNNGSSANLFNVEAGPGWGGYSDAVYAMVFEGIKIVPFDVRSPGSKFGSPLRDIRESYMAKTIASVVHGNPDAKVAVLVGMDHLATDQEVWERKTGAFAASLNTRLRDAGYKTISVSIWGGKTMQPGLINSVSEELDVQDETFVVDLREFYSTGGGFPDWESDVLLHLGSTDSFRLPGADANIAGWGPLPGAPELDPYPPSSNRLTRHPMPRQIPAETVDRLHLSQSRDDGLILYDDALAALGHDFRVLVSDWSNDDHARSTVSLGAELVSMFTNAAGDAEVEATKTGELGHRVLRVEVSAAGGGAESQFPEFLETYLTGKLDLLTHRYGRGRVEGGANSLWFEFDESGLDFGPSGLAAVHGVVPEPDRERPESRGSVRSSPPPSEPVGLPAGSDTPPAQRSAPARTESGSTTVDPESRTSTPWEKARDAADATTLPQASGKPATPWSDRPERT
ncbi:hypothetical protein [Nocardia callitridis]